MPPEILGAATSQPSPSTTTPDASTSAATSSGPDVSSSTATSSGPANTVSTTPAAPAAVTSKPEPKSMAEAIAAAFDASGSAPTADDVVSPAPAKTDADLKAEDPAKDAQADAPDPADATTKATGEDAPGPDAGKDDAPDPTKDELAAMPAQTRRRVQQLLTQRAGLREQVTALEPDAQGYRAVRTFMRENSLEDQEVADLFKLGADLKSNDPQRLKAFVARVMPIVQNVLEATGQVVPTDLRPRVDAGEMTEDAARELATTRHAAAAAQERARAAAQQTAQTTAQSRSVEIQQAVANWNMQTRQTDPDFDLKLDMMMHVAQAMVAQKGHPKTTAEAVEFAKQTHAEATRLLSKAVPPKAATRPAPGASVTSPTGTGLKPQPASLADAIAQAMDTPRR